MEWLIIFSLLTFQFILAWLQLPKGGVAGSDHFGHMNQIRLIRANGHRFIFKRPNWIYNDVMISAQLIHWLLSYLPDQVVIRYSKYMPLLVSTLALSGILGFVYVLYPHLTTDLSRLELAVGAGAIYVLTPYNFYFENAKNTGMSVRGIGVFFGQLQYYFTILFALTGNWYFYAGAVLSVLIIYLSSKFAMQFSIFSGPLLAILYQDWWMLFIPLFSFIVYLIIMPRYCIHYFRSQLGFKIFYYKYYAHRYILKHRYSVWRDFVYDFWKLIFRGFKKDEQGVSGLKYIYSNPAMVVIFGIPYTIPVLYGYYVLLDDGSSMLSTNTYHVLLAPIIASLVMFLGTSFRSTRFLGEPERYVDFATPFIIISAVAFMPEQVILHTIVLSFSVLFITLQMIKHRRIKKKKKIDHKVVQLNGLILDQWPNDNDVRVLSNRMQIIKALMNKDRKVFFGAPVNERVGKFHYTEVYDQEEFVKESMITPVINEFDINCLVLDTVAAPGYREALGQQVGLSFTQLGEVDELILFKVSHG